MSNKTTHQESVEAFMRLKGVPVRAMPDVPTDAERVLCARLLLEEVFETIHGMGLFPWMRTEGGFVPVPGMDQIHFNISSTHPCDVVEVADGLADVDYVSDYAKSCFGIAGKPIGEAVCENNLAKFGPGHRIDEHGKLIKPPGHPKPDIAGLLRAQGWTA